MSDRMKKNISFKKHEKDLYDFINDKSQVPDASAFIKGLIRDYMDSLRAKEEEKAQKVEQEKQSKPQLSQEDLQSAIDKLVLSIRDTFKSKPDHFPYGDFMEEVEKGVVLEKYDPKEDIQKSHITHNENNIIQLRDLDI